MVSRKARFGATWLLGMATFILGLAIYGIASSRWACGMSPGYSGYQLVCDLAWIIGAVAVCVAALHAVAATSIWRGHPRGLVTGVVLSLLGLLACTGFLEDERWWLVPPVSAGYLATLLVLGHSLIQGRPR